MKIEFNEGNFVKIFGIYRSVNRSHWKTPKFNEIIYSMSEKDYFEFVAGPKENWTSKLRFTKIKHEYFVDFLINENNTSDKIKNDLITLREKFLSELKLVFKDG